MTTTREMGRQEEREEKDGVRWTREGMRERGVKVDEIDRKKKRE